MAGILSFAYYIFIHNRRRIIEPFLGRIGIPADSARANDIITTTYRRGQDSVSCDVTETQAHTPYFTPPPFLYRTNLYFYYKSKRNDLIVYVV